jgi:hypothetical protein
MLPVNAAALVFAGMMSVLLYPMVARALLARARAEPSTAGWSVALPATLPADGASELDLGTSLRLTSPDPRVTAA